MTTVTPEQRLTIVKHLAAGKDLDWVAAATKLDRSVVLDIASRHGYPDTAKLAWARDVLTEKAQQPDPAPPAAAPAAPRTPSGPAQQQATVGQLIAAGRTSGSKRIAAQAERVAAGMQLADARAKLRGPRPHRQPPRPGAHPCTVEGCDRTFDTSQGRGLHQRRAHQ